MKAQDGLRVEFLVAHWLFVFVLGAPAAKADDAAALEDGFPYEAYVCVEGAEVVAGPGYRYYVTSRLPKGSRVEVYREEPSGWLAIRPPEGSFSWVPAEFVERHQDRPEVGRVKADVGAWVGTSIERVPQHRQQVTLQRGELVHILGEKAVSGPQGQPQRWLKIAPPAGEFRWIHLRDVRRGQPPPDSPSPQQPLADAEQSGEWLDGKGESHPRVSATEGSSLEEKERLAGGRASRSEARFAGAAIPLHDLRETDPSPTNSVALMQYAAAEQSVSPDGFVPRRRRPGSDEGLGSAATSLPARPVRRSGSAPIAGSLQNGVSASARVKDGERLAMAFATAPREEGAVRSVPGREGSEEISAEEIARQLAQLEVDLALMLARDRSQWNLAALRDQALVLVERGADPAWRGRARMLVDRIEQLAEAFQSEMPSRPLTPVSAVASGEVAAQTRRTVEEVRYDAQGWLKEVVSRQSNKPPAPYAVVDAQGRPVCFVSPTPGLNLHRYVNRQVGLLGRRGWLAELQKPHLLVERVIELDR